MKLLAATAALTLAALTPADCAPPAATEQATRLGVIVTDTAPLADNPAGLHGLPFAPEGLDNCAEMNFYRVQWGLPARFDGIGWRESNCRNETSVRTYCCYGYWQLYPTLHLRDHRLAPLYQLCDVHTANDYDGDTPIEQQRQACAARALFDTVGYSAWKATA